MDMTRIVSLTVGVIGLAWVIGLGAANSQQAPPTTTKGLTEKRLAGINLSQEFDSVQGREFRMRMVTIEPGGVIAVHSHRDRPALTYILQGTLTEYRDGVATEYHMGETIKPETKEVTHWVENKGPTPVVAVVVDIPKQP